LSVQPAIVVQNVSKHFVTSRGVVRALDEVNLTVAPGEFVAITGASGSGKSTLLSIVGGLLRATTGGVSIEGTDITRLGARRVVQLRRFKIGFVFQAFHLFEHLTALENVMLPLSFLKMGWPERRKRANELLDLVGLGHRTRHFPRQLSGGEKQRVAIARALANEPAVLLADEPTGNLDSQSTHTVLQLFRNLNQELGQTVVVVTHDPIVRDYADREVAIENGRLVDRPSQH